MSNYSIPFVRTNINSTTTTSLPYVTNQNYLSQTRIPPTFCSNNFSTNTPSTYNITTAGNCSTVTFQFTVTTCTNVIYNATYSGNIIFSNFSPKGYPGGFQSAPSTVQLTNITPGFASATVSNISSTGFTYTIVYNNLVGSSTNKQIYSFPTISFTYTANL
jgi:hypothetical protein